MNFKEIFHPLFEAAQSATPKAVWNRGIKLGRSARFEVDRNKPEEWIVRVGIVNVVVSPKVSLWPQEEDWFCDCREKDDPCQHVIAVLNWLKQKPDLQNLTTGNGVSDGATAGSGGPQSRLQYTFKRSNEGLVFDRLIVGADGRSEVLRETLTALAGGIQSGRLRRPALTLTQDDYAIEVALGRKKRGLLDKEVLLQVLPMMMEGLDVVLDGKPVEIQKEPVRLSVEIVSEKNGVRIRQIKDEEITELFRNGMVIRAGKLAVVQAAGLSPEERKILAGPGTFYKDNEIVYLVSEILPLLQNKINIRVRTKKLPKTRPVKPRFVLSSDWEEKSPRTRVLSITPQIVYGDPPVATVVDGQLQIDDNAEYIPLRSPRLEKDLQRQMRNQMHLALNQRVELENDEAIRFVQAAGSVEWEGEGWLAFEVLGEVQAHMDAGDMDEDSHRLEFEADFEIPNIGKRVQAENVFSAWKSGRSLVPLMGGGWGKLPQEWMDQYAERLLNLMNARDSEGKVPNYLAQEIQVLKGDQDKLQLSADQTIASMRKRLIEDPGSVETTEEEGPLDLPSDLEAELRDYQVHGVRWLQFLKKYGMGGVLADDMGLGKTLQAMCVMGKGDNLVLAPTSVVFSWAQQLAKFRPGLKVCVYHGRGRTLDEDADVVCTSYALLRLDADQFLGKKWDMIVTDESQVIKNPSSQVARVAHLLDAKYRVALTGTPIENRLEDLWSQFQFVNPGLLGTRQAYHDQFIKPIAKGGKGAMNQLRSRVKPFILRRIKKEVAKELPDRTETVLYFDLSDSEREIYQTLWLATRQDVAKAFEQGGTLIHVLEALLRLRQACCHPKLIPGQYESESSKNGMLIEALGRSIDAGHRCLVFSQWTSYLDLIEPELKSEGIEYLRLDGATRNRDQVVNAFQADDGPPIMLMSLKAGGLGLTLTAADHVFILDPWWNPAVEDQAADRAHRIGQKNPVLIHRLVARETIEERILKLQEKKRAFAQAVLEGAGETYKLTKEDILELIEP